MPSAADWNELHSDPLQADVATAETTSSTAYGNLTTVGPSVTKTLVNGQKVLVIVSCIGWGATDGFAYMSFEVSGASTLAASDINAARNRTNDNDQPTIERTTVFTATATGSHTFTAKYRASAGTDSFMDRRIIIKPF